MALGHRPCPLLASQGCTPCSPKGRDLLLPSPQGNPFPPLWAHSGLCSHRKTGGLGRASLHLGHDIEKIVVPCSIWPARTQAQGDGGLANTVWGEEES